MSRGSNGASSLDKGNPAMQTTAGLLSQSLTSLTLTHAPVQDAGIMVILRSCVSLRHLYLHRCEDVTFAAFVPSSVGPLTSTVLTVAPERAPGRLALEFFHFTDRVSTTGSSLGLLALLQRLAATLCSVELTGNRLVDDAFLTQFASTFPATTACTTTPIAIAATDTTDATVLTRLDHTLGQVPGLTAPMWPRLERFDVRQSRVTSVGARAVIAARGTVLPQSCRVEVSVAV
jgi:hypothetical protein